MDTALMWFRRDLRLADNPALSAAVERHERLIALYIHDPEAEAPWSPGAASAWWLHHSLEALDEQLRKQGGQLLIACGDALPILRKLIADCQISAVYWNRLYEPALIARDKQIKQALKDEGLTVESFNGNLLFEPWQIQNGSGQPYRVFTPYWRSLQAGLLQQIREGRSPLKSPSNMVFARADAIQTVDSLALLPKLDWDAGFAEHWKPGEKQAESKVAAFIETDIEHYGGLRDRPDQDGTSGLSAALHFGEISPFRLMALAETQAAGSSAPGAIANTEQFVRQLGWRDFAHHLLYHFPHTADSPLNERFESFSWRDPRDYAADLAGWQRGRTGIPIVDAGMRQLWHCGWMHNRVRMIAASFLCKNLLIPWQEGARWFWDTLVDADLANNSMGWQWVAGSGADAAPYFRIFNPVLQSKKFDPDGHYLRRWIPELSDLDSKAIHAPWQSSEAQLAKAGLKLGEAYPLPMVDLGLSRKRALNIYQQSRSPS